MALVAVLETENYNIDIYDNNKVPIGLSKNKYFLTPSKIKKIEEWVKLNNIKIPMDEKSLEILIENKLIGIYA